MEMAARYLTHCLADPHFYDSPHRWDDSASTFGLATREPPAGWRRTEHGLWIRLSPIDRTLPDQGWKVHVAADTGNAEHILTTVWRYCLRMRLPVRFLRSRAALRLTNSREADRTAAGRFCVIYPTTCAELHHTLTALGNALSGQTGPTVLGDLPWRPGPLSVRYGAFRHRHRLDDDGELAPALVDPTGRLVPDPTTTTFRVPPWVEVPPFLAERMPAAGSGEDCLPYRVQRPVRLVNGGGVYLARHRRTRRQVVLKEAWPMAGLDADEVDAVARLDNERAMAARLTDLDVVPRVLGSFTHDTRHFLVQEHVEGEPLTQLAAQRHPLGRPAPTPREVAVFTAWVVDVVGRLRSALAAIHERGVVVGDVRPSNVVVRPDGGVVLVDLELATPLVAADRVPAATPGFAAPAGHTGAAIDRYGLACTALWLFLPFAPLLCARDPGKTEMFLRVLGERFGVPETFVARMRRDLRAGRGNESGSHRPGRDVLAAPEPEDWPRLRRSLSEGIRATATPDRCDRLFPGDVAQFRSGGLNLAHGAAGVLLALATAGTPVDSRHVDWLQRAARRADTHPVGFYNGLHGIAYALDQLGRRAAALSTLDRAIEMMSSGLLARSLYGGLAGVGLNLLYFAHATGDNGIFRSAMAIADRLADPIRSDRPGPSRAAGLLHGATGIGLFFLRCHRETADSAFLDLAAAALRHDLDLCEVGPRDTLQVAARRRLVPFLGTGTAGMSLVLREFLRHRQDERLALAYGRIRRTCRSESATFPGLFTGQAGLLACLAATSDRPCLADPDIRTHLRRLSWHAEFHRGRLAFPGDQLLRLSTDLATGAAGVLLALTTVFESRRDFLPFLPADLVCRRPAACGAAPR
ncbi:serine/threonine protein kinase [Longimycelium tulufanense]|uniref:non-specific serine/threonine protein kinase n=1 Tax=Longimycelium tulufanense TaxID=907463 RepID=A0A8J3FV27_9PSEU|nr:class III lanthionine synthetase LanKC [Longimycelium tulufanense]GGM59973.1 serine/threonine protein kinase [Longimycelium tulufanense]